MTISKINVQNIFNTLPIGYYLGRNIPCTIEDTDTAYFDPANDRIVIGYNLIANALKNVDETVVDVESVIRGVLYHEISHTILTPQNLKTKDTTTYNDIINIFEDERIETLMKNYYMNVDFKNNLYIINNVTEDDLRAPKTAKQAFYDLVRFHIGETYWLDKVQNIISKYSSINSATKSVVKDYRNDIIDLYKKFTKSFKEKEINNNNSSSSNPSVNGCTHSDTLSNNSSNIIKSSIDSNGDNEYNIPDADNHIKNAIKNSINRYYDADCYNQLNEIITNKLKQKSSSGKAISSYSGRFNPRSVVREDYKWWIQQNRAGHIQHYSKVHFNLFIDNSGSFSSNDNKMNTFIRTLEKIKNEAFSFDIITINTAIDEWPDSHRIFVSNGGNCLTDSIAAVIKRHKKPNTNTYNIVLFDGDAHTDDPCGRTDGTDPFRHFDGDRTIIISDITNNRYIKKSIKKAKVVYTNKYCKEFIDAICKLLQQTI